MHHSDSINRNANIGPSEAPHKEHKRGLYCETCGVRVNLTNIDRHPFPHVLRFGSRVRCVSHDRIIDIDDVRSNHSECVVDMKVRT